MIQTSGVLFVIKNHLHRYSSFLFVNFNIKNDFEIKVPFVKI